MKIALVSLILICLGLVSVIPVVANTSAIIDATIIPEVISVKIPDTCPSSVNYTNVPLKALSRDPDGVPTLCAENNGSGKEDFEIRGADAESVGGNKWTLESSAGADQYAHKRAVVEGGVVGTFVSLTTTAVEFANDIEVGGKSEFRLRIDTPTESSSYEEHTTTVTVIATHW